MPVGRKAARGWTKGKVAAGIITALACMFALSACQAPPSSGNSVASSANGTTPTADGANGVPEVSNWSYSDYKDEMRGTTISVASTDSVESFSNNIGSDASHTSLTIQKFPNKMDVELINSNLQFTCSNLVETYFSVKFDDGPVSKYQCIDALGGKYGVAYFMSGGPIVNKLRKSKTLIVEAEVFGRGLVQMKFNISGLRF